MDQDRGEIYFIREHLGTGFSEFTKIGLVREKDGRSSADRIKEHQTGNPRPLESIKEVSTVFVSAVENTLHREFALSCWPSRIVVSRRFQVIKRVRLIVDALTKLAPEFSSCFKVGIISGLTLSNLGIRFIRAGTTKNTC